MIINNIKVDQFHDIKWVDREKLYIIASVIEGNDSWREYTTRWMYEAKKILCSMGMEYRKIHACPNDCILYRK